MSGSCRATGALIAAVLSAGLVRAQAPTDAPPSSTAASQDAVAVAMQAIRDDLASLRFEKVEAEVEALLGRPDLPEPARADAMALRAQSRASSGDFDGADAEYKRILAIRPSFAPDPAGTPRKAMQRFEKIRASTVGSLRFQIDPPDARVLVDGRDVVAGADGLAAALAGDRQVRVERRGYDALSFTVQVPAGAVAPLQARLVPNARTVVVRTEPDGVEVLVDGAPAGVTKRPAGEDGALAPSAAAELTIEFLPLGEHRFQLEKDCFHGQSFTQLLKVDLVERAPKVLDVVSLEPARAKLVPRGAPDGAVVRIDGAAAVPATGGPIEACPGDRQVEVLAGGRIVRRTKVAVSESDEVAVDLSPRPAVALLGADAWPDDFVAWAKAFDVAAVLPLPAGDPARVEAWDAVALPRDTDLALAVVPPAPGDDTPRRFVYSPILRTVEAVRAAPAVDPPRFTQNEIRVRLVDAPPPGGALVAEVLSPGPAATAGLSPGQRITAVAGKAVSDSRAARAAIAARIPSRPFEIRWIDAKGEAGTATVVGASGPVLDDGARPPGAAAVVAAWAAVATAAGGDAAPAAAADLALALARAGRHAKSIETWGRAAFGDRPGVGEGTVAYYTALSLLALGREAEAKELLEKARRSAATTFGDDGPEVAPAAADALRDLGVGGP